LLTRKRKFGLVYRQQTDKTFGALKARLSTPKESHKKVENNELKSKKPTPLIRVDTKAWIQRLNDHFYGINVAA